MKKSLIALAVISATGSAFAQSSVSIYGVVDTGYRSVTAGDNKYNGAANGSNMSNRLGFKGTEDLGGGMKAGFDMEGDLVPSDGTAGGFRFLRKSTVGLTTGFGEVRLGRDYTPTFRVYNVIDVFGYVGVGSAGNILGSHVSAAGVNGTTLTAQEQQNETSTFQTADRGTERLSEASGLRAPGLTTARITYADPNTVRANNTFAYYSPVVNGFSANVMYAPGTNTNSLKKVGDMMGGGVNYTQGPISAAIATQTTKGGVTASAANVPTNGTDDQKWTTTFAAASYDFGVAKAALGYRTDKLDVPGGDAKTKATFASLIAPMGPVTLKGSYITKKGEVDSDTDRSMGTQIAVGAVYDLSKRTALYATYARLNNKDGFANTVGSAATSAGGKDARGFDLGIRHSF
jgi:predicted porin